MVSWHDKQFDGHMKTINKAELVASLPHEWPVDVMPEIVSLVSQANLKIVVLDDDPTGTQTVHDVVVLTEWSIPSLCAVFADPAPVVYVLTNSRSVPLPQAQALNRDIALNLRAARLISGRSFVVISRSDSTLRGHYPGELNALAAALDESIDGVLIIPFFIEGGRLTIANTHFVSNGDDLIPVGETEYARDPVFGYQNSDLRAWVSEKNAGLIDPADVASITLGDIRVGGPEAVAQKLTVIADGQVCVVNAVTYSDLEVFVAGLLSVEATGKRFLYRTAASFARVRGGIRQRPLLRAVDLDIPLGGGLVVAGSYVDKTTQQLEAAQNLPHMKSVVISVPSILNATLRHDEIQRAMSVTEAALEVGEDVILFTSREIIKPSAAMTAHEIGQTISSALVSIVAALKHRPAWIIAKGGITASDIATRGLHVRKGYVLGQALPGIPIWRTGDESRWPGLTYVVFPGNVGGVGALADIVSILRRCARANVADPSSQKSTRINEKYKRQGIN